MSSAKGKFLRLVSGMLLKRASITAAEDVHGFRRLVLRADVPTFAAGTKVQLLLPSDDTRTYTPIPSPEGMLLLCWKHAGGPGARWASHVAPGEEVLFVGPQRSLELPAGPVVLVGDETSVAVAAALEAERPGQVHAVFQPRGDGDTDVRAAAATVGLRSIDVVGRGDTAAAVAMVVARLSATPTATVAVTGGSELVAATRDALRVAGVRSVKTKAYWIPGKVGLD